MFMTPHLSGSSIHSISNIHSYHASLSRIVILFDLLIIHSAAALLIKQYSYHIHIVYHTMTTPTTTTTTTTSREDDSTTTTSLKLSPSFQDNQHAIPLIPVVKEYAWGIRGMDSRVGRYAMQSGSIPEINPDVPYAELWIGTHSSGPAVLQDGRSLQDAVGGELPFLFKILSAGKALSIQAHPDQATAQRLYQQDPQHYPDPNHKPEMAIALTPFEAMCGFRRLEEIALLLKKHAEFAACISTKAKLQIFLASSKNNNKKHCNKC